MPHPAFRNVKSVAELIDYSKQQPGGLDSVAGTLGGLQHMTVEAFRARSGAKLNMRAAARTRAPQAAMIAPAAGA